MIILFGFGKTTKKNLGPIADKKCKLCTGSYDYELLKITTWFTLFFIPIIPYKFKYFLVCPNCSRGFEITKDQFESIMLTKDGIPLNYNNDEPIEPAGDSYAGKNEVQRNFLRIMEQAKKQKRNN